MLAEVIGTQLKIEKNEQLTQGRVGLQLDLHLSEDWEGLTVTAVFTAGGVFRDVAVEGDTLLVPWELFVQPGRKLFLSFHGARADGSVVLRSNIAALGEILPSLAPSGEEPQAPSPARADQIQALAEQALAAAQAVSEAAAAGAFDGTDGVSPAVSVSKTGDTATITVTDASGSSSVSVRDGVSPDPALLLGAYPARSLSGGVLRFDDGAAGLPVKDLRIAIEPVQSGSGNPSPENIRPITGWTGVNVVRTGTNIWGGEKMADDFVAGIHNAAACYKGEDENGAFVRFTAGAAIDGKVIFSGPFRENTQYTFIMKRKKSNNNSSSNIVIRYTDGTFGYVAIGTEYMTVKSIAFVSAAGKTVNHINAVWGSGTTYLYYDRCGIFEGVLTAGNFEAYQGGSCAIDWTEEAGTVYGGTLNVTTGELTKRPYYASYNGETLVGPWISSEDVYAPGAVPTAGAQVVDLGGTPTTVQLAPTELRTLLGSNTVWADAGTCSLEYRADPTTLLASILARLDG